MCVCRCVGSYPASPLAHLHCCVLYVVDISPVGSAHPSEKYSPVLSTLVVSCVQQIMFEVLTDMCNIVVMVQQGVKYRVSASTVRWKWLTASLCWQAPL